MQLRVRVDPAGAGLAGHVVVRGCEEFLLHHDLAITSVERGSVVAGAGGSPFVDRGRAWVARPGPEGDVEFSYEGRLPGLIADGANVFDEHLVELAAYSAWYPVPADLRSFSWRLELHLPYGWEAITNGRLAQPGRWASYPDASVADLVVAAAPVVTRRLVDSAVRINEVGGRSPLADQLRGHSVAALGRLAGWYGAAGRGTVVDVVLADRDGFNYSRLPAIFLAGRGTADPAEDVHVLHHELAHLWWNIAAVASPDDWLNEALAEYSAVRLTSLTHPVAAQRIVGRHRAMAATAGGPPMRQTGPAAAEFFAVNKYARGSLFFLGLANEIGENRLDQLLSCWREDILRGHTTATIGSLLGAIADVDPAVGQRASHLLLTPAWDVGDSSWTLG